MQKALRKAFGKKADELLRAMAEPHGANELDTDAEELLEELIHDKSEGVEDIDALDEATSEGPDDEAGGADRDESG